MFSTPFLLSHPPSISPLSFCTSSNERRRVREVKVQQKDKPLFAGKQKLASDGFSPLYFELGKCNVGRAPPLIPPHHHHHHPRPVLSESLQECVVRFTLGESGCMRSCVLAKFLLGKCPGASMSISCLTQITCSPRDQSLAQSFVQFLGKVRFFFFFFYFSVLF